MLFEIVCHCWKYSRLLSYQLSSLVHNPPAAEDRVIYTLCYCPEDEATRDVIDYFCTLKIPGVFLMRMPLDHPELANRAIGRNRAALSSSADWVWFTDADYYVLPGFFSQLAEICKKQDPNVPLIFPRYSKATEQPRGLELVKEAAGNPRVLPMPAGPFIDSFRYRVAIGGIQFVRGTVCRRLGYLNGRHRDLRPYHGGNWRPNVEDARFRRGLNTPKTPIRVIEQNFDIVRIRHGVRGAPDVVVDL